MANEQLLNTVIQGDCLTEMKRIADGSIDMILCDLPYGTTRNKWDSVIPLGELWAEYNRVIKDNGAIVLTAQPPFDKMLAVANIKNFRYEWIWEKNRATGHLNAKKMPLKATENVLIFYKNLPTYNPQGLIKKETPTIRRGRDNGSNYGKSDRDALQEYTNYPQNVLQFPSESKTLHPTQKPVALFEYLIKTYTNEGETVLDNCLGSGTTAVAAINTGRNFIGIEREPEYVTIANQRIDDARKTQKPQ